MHRRELLQILHAGLEAVDGRRCVRECLSRGALDGPVHLIAAGKAAARMSLGAADVLGGRIVDGYIVTRAGYGDPELASMPHFQVREASHPVPDQSSVAAGKGLLRYAAGVPPGEQVLGLVSGGASSLVEVPVAGVDAAHLEKINVWLLGSGLDIFGMNAVRRRLSRLKDGGLAAALSGHPVLALYLSDVKGDDPAWIGSGLFRHAETQLPPDLPVWLRELLGKISRPPVAAGAVEHRIVGNLERALEACGERARRLGHAVTRHPEWLAGPVEQAAVRLLTELEEGPPGIHLWGGETTVTLPPSPGRGGRSQHLALCCAMGVSGRDDVALVCAASDGADGNSEDAGAIVDGATLQRGRDGGADPEICLAAADSGAFLEAAGDLLFTGPTGTNVNDLVIGFKRGLG